MRLSDEQKKMFFAAGTVSLPGPFPELGEIRWERQAIVFDRCGDSAPSEDLLCIRSGRKSSWNIERYVRAKDVVAILLPMDACAAEADPEKDHLLVGCEIELLEKFEQANRTAQDVWKGIVYVAEDVRILMQVEFAMTAADSVHYQPAAAIYRRGCDCPD